MNRIRIRALATACALLGMGVGLGLAQNNVASLFPSEDAELQYARGMHIGFMLAQGDTELDEFFLNGLSDGLAQTFDTLDRSAVNALVEKWLRVQFNNARKKSSYALGWSSAQMIHDSSVELDPFLVTQGVWDALSRGPAPFERQEAATIVRNFQRTQRKVDRIEFTKVMVENEQAGKAFLAENRTRAGVEELPSGLQYEVLNGGHGAPPTIEDTVSLSALGRNIEGTVFYDSTELSETLRVPVSSTIHGWQTALTRMRPGSEWRVYIPAQFAYGEVGWQDKVAPGETVIYDLRLIAVE